MNTKEKLMQLLELCIEKGLSYEMMNENKIQVYDWKNGEFKFSASSYLYYFDSEEKEKIVSERIESVITKVKNYQP